MLLAGEQCPKCGAPATIAPFIDERGRQTSEVVLHSGCPDAECQTPDDPPTVTLVEVEVQPDGEPVTYRAETHEACWARYQEERAAAGDEPPAHDWELDELDGELDDEEPAGPDEA
jgi:hypothetical protein